MDIAISTPSLHLSSSPLSFKSSAAISLQAHRCRNAYPASLFFGSRRIGRRIVTVKADQSSSRATDDGFIIEDVPHLTDFLPGLPVMLKTFITQLGTAYLDYMLNHNDFDHVKLSCHYAFVFPELACNSTCAWFGFLYRSVLVVFGCLWHLCRLHSQFQLIQVLFSCYGRI